jgi:hypothetical protein
MTVLEKRAASEVEGRRFARLAAVALLGAVVGIGAGFGLSRVGDEKVTTIHEGPAVERSLAMNERIGALTKSAYAQQAGGLESPQSGTVAYEGAAVERSLAMNGKIDDLMRSAYAQQAGARSDR